MEAYSGVNFMYVLSHERFYRKMMTLYLSFMLNRVYVVIVQNQSCIHLTTYLADSKNTSLPSFQK